MTTTIWDSIAMTPWWVFLVYAYLIRLSLLAIKPRLVLYKSMRNMTIYFIVATVTLLLFSKELTTLKCMHWLGALLAGCLLGWLQFYALRIKAVKDTQGVRMPGNWIVAPLILALMYAHYHKGYDYIFNLNYFTNPHFLYWLPATYGLMAGLFIGKAFYIRQCIKSDQRIDVLRNALSERI